VNGLRRQWRTSSSSASSLLLSEAFLSTLMNSVEILRSSITGTMGGLSALLGFARGAGGESPLGWPSISGTMGGLLLSGFGRGAGGSLLGQPSISGTMGGLLALSGFGRGAG
jgi:hypothetical protein